MDNRQGVTLKSIASKTGFSVKTVSRAINDHPDISEETRKKILAVVKKCNYYPNLLARGLRKNRTCAIGYAVPEMTNQFFAEVGLAVENVFKKYGYSTLISFTGDCPEDEITSLKLLISRRVDGIILGTAGENEAFLKEVIKHYGIPIVLIDNKVKGLKVDVVLHDNVEGAYLLNKHLIMHGHKNIACITGPLNQTAGKGRLDGYKKALSEFGIRINNNLIKVANWRIIDGFNFANELIESHTRKPTAIFASNAVMALGVLKALRKRRLKVPDDMALVSFDNLDFTEAVEPPLTTLSKIERKIGCTAAELLFNRIKEKNVRDVQEVYVEPELCVRQSCGCNENIN